MRSAAEAPLIAEHVGVVLLVGREADATTCTSFRKPFGKSGRSGRSVRRAVRIALGGTALAA